MRKLCLLWLAALLLYSCGDSDSSNSATDIIGTDNSHSIETSSSNIRCSSSSEPDEDKTYSSSKAKLSSSSTKKTENSSSVDHKNSSSSKKTKSSSSSVEHGNPVQTSSSSICIREVSPIHFLPLTAKPNADKSEFFFYGGADFHIFECTADASDETDFIFTDVNLQLVHVNELGQNEQARINIQYTPPTLQAQTIDFAQMGVKISDSAKTQCGNFKLFVVLMATDDPKMHDRFVSVDSIEFVREPIYCPVESKSSSSAEIIEPKVELRKFTGNMSTSETRGYSFKEDGEVPKEQAQIQISMDELTGILTLHGLDGYKVVIYDNDKDKKYNDDWTSRDLPPSPTFTTDFKFTETKLIESTRIHGFLFAIVIGPNYNKETGDDFYAITIKNNDYLSKTVEIIYYKK
jgi:hypothetical protein